MSKSLTYQNFIIEELEKGNVKHKDVYSLFYAKFRLTKKTFDGYWKKANKTHTEAQQALKAKKIALHTEMELEAFKKGILGDLETQKFWSDALKMLYNNASKSKSKEDLQAFSNALKDFRKDRGFDNPNKLDITTGGEKVTSSLKLPEGQTMEDVVKEVQGIVDKK